MEEQENGCTSRSECVNYPDKCSVCSAHYSSEFADTEKEKDTLGIFKSPNEEDFGLKSECINWGKRDVDKLLKMCKESGYTRVSIGMKHKSIPESMTFPFDTEGSIFAFPTRRKQFIDGSPAIWKICEDLDIKGYCGNSHQHEIINLGISGVWHLRKGKWKRVEE